MKLEKFHAEKMDLKSAGKIFAGAVGSTSSQVENTQSSESDPDSNSTDSDRPVIIIVEEVQ
jgi:hypothetical protein